MPRSSIALPSHADRVLLFMNPKAGARSGKTRVAQLVELLTERHLEVSVLTDPRQLAQTSRDWQESGRLRAIVAAGGDGTAALAINESPLHAPITVLPLGTENLLAKHLGLRHPSDVCRAIEHGAITPLDVGQVNGRLFLLMLSCGFDADVVHRLHAGRSGHIRHLSYAKPILDSLRTYDYPEIRVTLLDPPGGEPQPISARWVFVMNLPCYARGLPIVPEANGVDGLLDVCTFRGGSWWNGLRYLGGILLGRHRQGRDCRTFMARRLRIESDRPTPFQIDGDPGGQLPIEVELLPARWSLLAPASWHKRMTNAGDSH